MRCAWASLLALKVVLTATAASARAPRAAYVLAIGNNAPAEAAAAGEAAAAKELRYADDDAVRYFQFLGQLATQAHLLTVLDADTVRRYPELAANAQPPTLVNLRRALAQIREAMRADLAAGREPVLYFAFSGHGQVDEHGEAYLALEGGRLSQNLLYQEVIDELPARRVHMFIDACHAGAVVGVRGGMFGSEREVAHVTVDPDKVLPLLAQNLRTRHPHLGVIVAYTSDNETHEWSRIESGVFTHELLSALAGAADVNHDGAIEYSEVHAFVAAANRGAADPRAIFRVVALPPRGEAKILALDDLKDSVYLSHDRSRLGHFFVELANGQRYLDAHLGAAWPTRLAVPKNTRAYVRTAELEATLDVRAQGTVKLSELAFRPREARARGSVEAAYQDALFSAPYGDAYYRGFVDRMGEPGVRFDASRRAGELPVLVAQGPDRTVPVTALTVSGVATVASVTLFVLAVGANDDFDNTTFQRPAKEASDRFALYWRSGALSLVVAIAAGVVAWQTWPHVRPGLVLAPGTGEGGATWGASLELSW